MKTTLAATSMIFFAITIATLSGCAAFSTAYAAKEEAVEVDSHTAQKNAIKTLTFAICAVPYGDIILNPAFQPVAKAACLPSGGLDTSPTTLLPAK